MAQPTYDRAYNFNNYQTRNPNTPLPATQIEAELNRVKQTTDQLGQNLSLIQRDDGALGNATVGRDQLKTDLSVGFNAPVHWSTSTRYTEADTVFEGTGFYQCEETHVSGVFATDLAAGKWTEIADFSATAGAAMAVYYNNATSGLTATNAQAALDELVVDLASETTSRTSGDSGLQASIDAINATLTKANPVGRVTLYAGSTAPSGWRLCHGQALSRTTLSALFAVIGTTYGAGDGSTTFNMPDFRGRVPAGLDNMGGSSANRLTAAAADTLGGALGAETHTLTSAEMPVHTHTANAHSHTVTDPGHTHTIDDMGLSSAAVGSGANGNTTRYGTQQETTNSSTTGLTVDSATVTLQNAGSGGAHNNVQPTLAINYIIYAGV